MNKAILSVSGAFISFLCAIVLLTAFAKSEDGLFAVLAVIFAAISIGLAGWGIEGSDFAEMLSNMFAEEEVSNE